MTLRGKNPAATKAAYERAIYWQRHIAANALSPEQKKRAEAAIQKLTKELKEL